MAAIVCLRLETGRSRPRTVAETDTLLVGGLELSATAVDPPLL